VDGKPAWDAVVGFPGSISPSRSPSELGRRASARLVEIGEIADVVDLQAHRAPAQAAQTEYILGQQVVLDESGVLAAVLRDDAQVAVVEQAAALRRFPSPRAAQLRVATSRRCCRGSGPTAADRRESSGQANTSSETHTAVPAACPDGKLLSWAVARG
jgi:hypothetical protein